MPERIQEQKPGSSNSSKNNNNNSMQPSVVESDVSDDNGDSREIQKSDRKSQTQTNNSSSSTRQGDNDSDILRHESPPSKMRECMDIVNQARYRCGAIINNENIQFLIVLLIAINAIMMGIGTFDFVTENPEVEQAFETTDQVFLIIFTVELCMQFVFHGWRLLLDGWLVFDLIVIVMSWSFQQVQIIRAFRIFRALRLITRIEVMKNLVLGK